MPKKQSSVVPRAALDALRRAEAETHIGKKQTIVGEACAAVGFPTGRVYPLASELTPPHRALAERLADIDVYPYPYAMPSRPAIRKRWLGISPTGILEEIRGKEPLWRAIQLLQAANPNVYEGAKAVGDYLNSLPVLDRLRVFGELHAILEPAAVYDIDAQTLFRHGLRLVDDLDLGCSRWAVEEADRLSAQGRRAPEEIRWVVFLALVRAKVPIEPRWDVLLPVLFGAKDWAFECAAAIPTSRRGPALSAALRASHPNYALTAALDLLERFPSREILEAYFDISKSIGHAPRVDLPRLEKVAAKHPDVRVELDARMKRKVALLKLHVTDDFAPMGVSELSVLQKKQLVRVGTLYDGRKLDAEARIGDGEWETTGTFRGMLTITELADEAGKPRVTVFECLADSGTLFRAGTTKVVAQIIQCGLECEDTRLHEALYVALDARDKARRNAKKKARPTPKSESKKRAAADTEPGSKAPVAASRASRAPRVPRAPRVKRSAPR